MNESTHSSVGKVHFVCISYSLLTFFTIFALVVFEVLPALFVDMSTYLTNLLLFVYAMTNIAGNYYYLMFTDVTCRKVVKGREDQRAGFSFCHSCQKNSPPRSHHCIICNSCVARRDHHCFIVANCIGMANLRFFVNFALFCLITSLYAASVFTLYLHRHIGPLLPMSIEGMTKLIPVITAYKYWTGNLEFVHMLVVIATWICLLQAVAGLVIWLFQLYLVFSGQTSYEWKHGIFIYDLGLIQNCCDLFGTYWYLWWFFPVYHWQPLELQGENMPLEITPNYQNMSNKQTSLWSEKNYTNRQYTGHSEKKYWQPAMIHWPADSYSEQVVGKI